VGKPAPPTSAPRPARRVMLLIAIVGVLLRTAVT
jgi:hypothetical protein